jgi:predicted GIY-YIG superfamily endonuclease
MQQKLGYWDQLKNTSVNLQSLPFCFLKEKHLLPKNSGIYFVIDETNKVYYIGKAVNFRARWTSHHRVDELEKLEKQFKIAYLTIIELDSLLQVEKAMINKFAPLLNHTTVKKDTRRVEDIPLLYFDGIYATVIEATAILGVNDSYVRQLLRRGNIPGAVKIGRDWIIPVIDGQIKIKEKENDTKKN